MPPAVMKPILEVGASIGLDPQALRQYGRYVAKVPLDAVPAGNRRGNLVLVTAMTPGPSGEGKTTTAIGLVDAMCRLGQRAVLAIRQPSLRPLFGIKGGGTGGGMARVVPEDEIGLHFTGDAHAVSSSHNLLAAMVDNAVHLGAIPGLGPDGIVWPRVTDAQDRALRSIIAGVGGRANSPLREAEFILDAASEVMAVLALSTSLENLRARLGRLVVAFDRSGQPFTASDVGAVGPMLSLLRHAIQPNLVQTMEGNPALVHAGPFGNIAHGCSSVVASTLGLRCADYLVTEAGFAADLGFEKYMDIVARSTGITPSAAVVVVTARALKWHGGASYQDSAGENVAALEKGCDNLAAILNIVKLFNVPAVVAINRFSHDTNREISAIQRRALELGANAVECNVFANGGGGATDLAEVVMAACRTPASPTYLYAQDASIQDEVASLATRLYGAGDVEWSATALRQVKRFQELGWNSLPVCIAKTNLSLSHDPNLRGRPTGYTFPVTGAHISAGAGFVYILAGNITTLPGLPAHPRAIDMDVSASGEVTGL